MKKFAFIISFFMILLTVGCSGGAQKQTNNDINPADTIYLGDLRDKFQGDSLFFKIVAPDLVLTQYQYTWIVTDQEAENKGLEKEYIKKIREEVSKTNAAIRKGVMKGANVKRVPDFQ